MKKIIAPCTSRFAYVLNSIIELFEELDRQGLSHPRNGKEMYAGMLIADGWARSTERTAIYMPKDFV